MRLELWCGTAWIAANVGSLLRSQFSIVLLATHDDRNISPECIEPTSEEPEIIISVPHEHVHCSRVVDIDRLPVCETVAQTAILHGEDDRVLLVGAVVGQVDVSCFGTRGTRSSVSKPK